MRRRFTLLIIVASVAMILTGCGTAEVDESLLPTRVPNLNMQNLVENAVAARPTERPTPTNTPVPTPEPVVTATEETVIVNYGDATVVVEVEEPAAEDTVEATDDTTVGTATPAETSAEELAPLPTATPTQMATAGDEADSNVEVSVTPQPETPEDSNVEVTAEAQEAESDASTVADATTEPPADDLGDTAVVTDTEAITTTTTTGDVVTDSLNLTVTANVSVTSEVTVTEGITETEVTDSENLTDTAEANSADAPPSELPDSVAEALENADLGRGENLTLSAGCTGCHFMDPNQIAVGPSWYDLANTAANRVEGQGAELYLYNSILHPNQYVVEGYQENIMLQIYEDTLSDQDLADIIAYLMTLRGR